MQNLKTKLVGTAAVIGLAVAFAASANATPTRFLYAGGATFPEKQYRDLMNCYGDHSGTDTETGLTSHICSTGDSGFTAPYNADIQLLYAGVGSGNGKKALWNHDAGATGLTSGGRVPDSVPVPSTADQGPHYGTATGAAWAATKSTANPFATISYIGSDDPLLASDLTTAGQYNDHSAANNWGPAIAVPSFVGAVGIGYSPATGTWVEKGKKPSGAIGAFNLVSLKTNTWCGIMTGAITDWNNAEITADNGGVSITGGVSKPITVVYRSDGSGTTFIFANAFIHQCDQSTHPIPASWESAVKTGGSAPNTNVPGQSNNNWFLNIAGAGLLPTTFVGQPGNGGIHDYITAVGHEGSVGYLSTDFLKPVDSTGPRAMNLQTYATFVNALAPVFKQPNTKTAAAIMASAAPPLFTAASCTTNTTYNPGTSPDGICAHNPVNWGATNPTPLSTAAYPIGGFTFHMMYSCYNPAGLTDVNALVSNTAGALGWFRWFYGSPTQNLSLVKNSLAKNGFGPIPGKWSSGVKKLLFSDVKTKIGIPGQAKTACSGLTATGGA
ncbi:MAG TPA: substrate-binding domain-containing protein [Micropepsaceae bacterium]|nr:substrate-binding domain-containing protein [Micropepsaceae bacterium]